MRWRDFSTLICFVIAAVVFGVLCKVILSPDIMWLAPIVSLGLILIGLGVNSLLLLRYTDKRIEAINVTLKNIEQIQETMRKEQEEQSRSTSTVAPTLQAFSQLYLDYFTRQQGGGGEEQQNDDKDS